MTQPLSKEDLLKPRYLVKNDYPENKDFPVGKVIEFEPWNTSHWCHKVNDCQGERLWLSTWFANYPHLFEWLFWYENRTIEQMPEYVMWQSSHDKDVAKVDKWRDKSGFECRTQDEEGSWRWDAPGESDLMPATAEEYQQYLTTLNK